MAAHDIAREMHRNMLDCFEYIGGSSITFFTPLIEQWEKRWSFDEIKSAFESNINEWYYGNVIHGILSFVFCPYVLGDGIWDEDNLFVDSLSSEQVNDAFDMMEYIIKKYHVDKYLKDYYESSPFEAVKSLTNQNMYDKLPQHLQFASNMFMLSLY